MFVDPVIAFTLLNPSMAVAGVLCVLIPIIIHLLFRRRRKPIQWATMRFIIDAWEKNRRRIRFQRNTLLLIRCAIPLLLGLALAEPMLNSSSWLGTNNTVFFIIDDGPTTGVRSDSGTTEIESLKQTVVDIASTLAPGTDISTTTTSQQTHDLKPHETYNSFIQKIESIESTTMSSGFDQAIRDARNSFVPGRKNTIYIVSPFRHGSTLDIDTTDVEWPLNVDLKFTPPTTNEVNNLRVESITPLRRIRLAGSAESSTEGSSRVKIVREGSDLGETNTSFTVESGSESINHEFEWDAGEKERTIYIKIPLHDERSNPTTVSLLGEDDLPVDDARYTTTYTRPSMKLIHLNQIGSDTPDWFTLAINPTQSVSIETTAMHPGSLQSGDLTDSPMIILSAPELVDDVTADILAKHVADGGVLMVTPSTTTRSTGPIQNLINRMGVDWVIDDLVQETHEPQALTTTGGSTPLLEPVIDELPDLLESTQVFRRMVVETTYPEDVTIAYTDGTPAIMVRDTGSNTGLLMLATFCLDTSWTNLPTQPVIIPLVQELVRGSLGGRKNTKEHLTGEFFSTDIQNPTHMDFNQSIRIPFDPSTRTSTRVIELPGVWNIQGDENGYETVNIDPDLCSTSTTTLESMQERLGPSWSVINETQEVQSTDRQSHFIQTILLILLFIVVIETILSKKFTTRQPIPQPTQ